VGYLSDYNNWKSGRWGILNNISWGSWGYLGKKSLPKKESGQLEWLYQIRKVDIYVELEGVIVIEHNIKFKTIE
jgi:hypothetical protein